MSEAVVVDTLARTALSYGWSVERELPVAGGDFGRIDLRIWTGEQTITIEAKEHISSAHALADGLRQLSGYRTMTEPDGRWWLVAGRIQESAWRGEWAARFDVHVCDLLGALNILAAMHRVQPGDTRPTPWDDSPVSLDDPGSTPERRTP